MTTFFSKGTANMSFDTVDQSAICLQSFRLFHPPVKIPCGHIFGYNCIDKWFKSKGARSKACPMCRRVIPVPTRPSQILRDLHSIKGLPTISEGNHLLKENLDLCIRQELEVRHLVFQTTPQEITQQVAQFKVIQQLNTNCINAKLNIFHRKDSLDAYLALINATDRLRGDIGWILNQLLCNNKDANLRQYIVDEGDAISDS
ncbi:hypothetical protein K491DRAFT_284670 [Lophiostoma macrostomum CBS 122681]|uniref:RING-type domain-containing protein n=1 Tax=Lophiostoma macrostomum CBS 122681 TaxID=1314788 RepID=A0A6A6TQB8_9PLEO|nr:hypothetical protein K491DRAFT_284670 [Lophiostoma macrostomum CBS 122681]